MMRSPRLQRGNPPVARSVLVRSFPAVVPVLFLSSCLSAFGIKDSDGLSQVDELLDRVERVQVESVVAKERVHSALDGLHALVAPEFHGDAVAAHAELQESIEQSLDQAKKLAASVQPLRRTGEAVFAQWTEDLESFGNTSMRQRSQTRLEETRTRYEAVLAAAGSAQLALDALDADLSDHALFLEHDFSAASVAMIADEVDGLRERIRELDRRLDACAAAYQSYVESAALRGQLASEPAAQPKTSGRKDTDAR